MKTMTEFKNPHFKKSASFAMFDSIGSSSLNFNNNIF